MKINKDELKGSSESKAPEGEKSTIDLREFLATKQNKDLSSTELKEEI